MHDVSSKLENKWGEDLVGAGHIEGATCGYMYVSIDARVARSISARCNLRTSIPIAFGDNTTTEGVTVRGT